jgi:hypothetical protein
MLQKSNVRKSYEEGKMKDTRMKDMQQTPTRGYRQLRKGRHSIPGFYYSLTVCTLDKRPLLANTEAADIIFKSFDWLEANDRLEWFCVVVMPDHIHGVIQLARGYSTGE